MYSAIWNLFNYKRWKLYSGNTNDITRRSNWFKRVDKSI